MDIGINEVKDIIESLESNGEVSIKEEKYLKVAKLCVQLAAENVALKRAESNLVRNIINDLGDTEFQYARVQTPATDRIVAGIKADGVEEFAKHCDDSIGFVEPEDEELYTMMEEQAREFAKQLRDGGQS